MSENKVPPVAPAGLTDEQIEAISGGGNNECIAANINSITSQLKASYEDLVDLASHVIERVVAR